MRAPLLIVNPAARGGGSAEGEALQALRAAGLAPRLHRTTGPGDAADIAAREAGDDDVFVLGGDGTVMEAVRALVGRPTRVAILPGGTGNQLARHFGIPLRVRAAAQRLASAAVTTATLDLGRLGDGRVFALTAGFGLDAAMIAGTPTAAKRRFGVGAYVWSAAKALPQMTTFRLRAEADGRVIETEAALAMVANVGAIMGGRLGLGPGISPTDGLLDLCILSPSSLAAGVGMAWRMARRDFGGAAGMQFVRASHITLEVSGGIPAQADGELLAAARLEATALASAARFVIPA